MAEQQNEYGLPLNGNEKRRSARLLPRYYRTESNKKFIQATVDQLTQSGTVKKVNGYIGRRTAKAATGNDVFIDAVTDDRQNYQLEPGAVVKDTLGNVTFFKDYLDYINTVDVLGGIADNHQRLNKQEFYSWNPHINWDKFVNFQQYYWMPYGPELIKVVGQQRAVVSTYTVELSDEGDNRAYLFTPDGLTRNPTLKLYRGQTYKFEINTPGEPFSIKLHRSEGSLDRYTNGVDNYAVEQGTITFTVPDDAPSVLYFSSENSIDTGGAWEIYDILENTFIDVAADIIGKKTYTLSTGLALSNGMKIAFEGNVTPAEYATGSFYVEGVGSSIKLVPSVSLEIITSYSQLNEVLFDDTAFDALPFAEASAYAGTKDYITINRANTDGNPWSRYNRWIHQDVIMASAEAAGVTISLDQAQRAKRPIIEFESNLKLFNFGTVLKKDVDLIDTFTTDAFSKIEGQQGYHIDGIALADGHRIIFSAETDELVKDKIFRVEFITVSPPTQTKSRQIHLVEEDDSTPLQSQTVIVKNGVKNQGKMYWYNGTDWILSQQKTGVNQCPLFDLFDNNGISLTDTTEYPGSNFAGNKLFSYKVGTGTKDTELGFALSYKNIDNIGDIVFTFDLLQNDFTYKVGADVATSTTNSKFLKRIVSLTTSEYINGWTTSQLDNVQPIVRVFKDSGLTNKFPVDVYDYADQLADLEVKVYVNGKRVAKDLWNLVDGSINKIVVFNTAVSLTDIVTLKCFASQPKNANGYYELPINFQNNPLNNDISTFTLGEAIDHVDSIVGNLSKFTGTYPGDSNLRDLGDVSPFGTKFAQHSGPLNFGLYHLTSKNSNIFAALQEVRDDYGRFKRHFINVAEAIGEQLNVKEFVDQILFEISKDKSKATPYYFSDMLGYGASIKTEFTVVDYRIKTYPLSTTFNLDTLSNKAVNVYLNSNQLLYGNDYTFNAEGFVYIKTTLNNDDIVTIYEYESTDGCFVPPTPTSFGLWPKYVPRIYLDTTLVTPQEVIQGHDGSIILAYGQDGVRDYRDEIILELEKRIFNNIKVQYNPDIFDIHEFIPGYSRPTDYSLEEFNQILAPSFYQWTTLIDQDFSKPMKFDETNPFTYNYSINTAPDGSYLPGYWRGIYQWVFDTDRVHLCPWESLGFSIMPSWWEATYGPAPYTSDNLVLWADLKDGIIKEPNKPPTRNPKYARPILDTVLPVDEYGNLLDPIAANIAGGYIQPQLEQDFVFGAMTPIEASWRRSSYYAFSVIATLLLMQPNKILGTCLDRSRIVRSINNQLIYSDTGLRLRLQDLALPSIPTDSTRVLTAGLVNYLVDYILSDNLKSLTTYKAELASLTNQLSYRLSGFTSKEKFNLILDSKNPTATSGVYIPQENYSIFLNTSSPTKKLSYSGVIVTKVLTRNGVKYEIKGYGLKTPYFKYYPWTQSGLTINVGGISESYIDWVTNQTYVVGNIVHYNNSYYRVTTTHTTDANFDSTYYQKLPKLPIIGGQNATLRKRWDRIPTTLNYGTVLDTIQDVVDFLQGYGEYLKDQGFVFDDYNTNLRAVASWDTSIKEFMFWTTQNWSSGVDKYVDWLPSSKYKTSDIVMYNGRYYTVKADHTTGMVFDSAYYTELDSLSQEGASVISLSPAALGLSMNLEYAVLEDIRDPFNEYQMFRADGFKFDQHFLNYTREQNTFSFSPRVTGLGIYGAGFYLVQKEHVLIIDNTTQFNDTIYNLEAGYRQERINVSGYKTIDWYGGFDIPGFIFDQAKINDWSAWQDYNLGDIVKYKEFYYSATAFLPGVETFNASSWVRLTEKPTAQLLPNWDYKAEQFTDFYDLESSNFDSNQQKIAQHLIGYQKRQYLENIIKNDVSEYKFYQGMIQEKGSANSLHKLFDVLSATDKESITFDEEWAVRVGQYGASEAFDEVEFTLDETAFKTNGQAFELVDAIDASKVDFVIRQTPADIYVKPRYYNSNIWPISKSTDSYLRTPGYVKYDQVTSYIDTLADLAKVDIAGFNEGDYVWCAFEGRDWNVYRLTEVNFKVSAVTYSNNVLTLSTETTHNISASDVIGIINSTTLAGFHTVASTTLQDILINQTFTGIQDPFQDLSSLVVYKLTLQRSSSINSPIKFPKKLKYGELMWTDDAGNGKPAVWKNIPVYEKKTLVNNTLQSALRFGRTIEVSYDGSTMITSDDADEALIYNKSTGTSAWARKQAINIPAATGFGSSIAISSDNVWLAIASPRAGNVSSYYAGEYSGQRLYSADVGKIFYINGVHWRVSSPQAGQDPATVIDDIHWEPAYLVNVDETGVASALVNQGQVSLYQKDANGDYQLVTTFVSPYPQNNEFFGSKMKFAKTGNDYILAISSPGYNSNAGRVYLYNYSASNTRWQMNYDRKFRGSHSNTIQYYTGDIVSYNNDLYQARRDLIGPLLVLADTWKLVTDVDTQGYLPHLAPASTGELYETSTDGFGHDFDISFDGTYLVVGAPTNVGKVFAYKHGSNKYTLIQSIVPTDSNADDSDEEFGTSIAVAPTGSMIAVGSLLGDVTVTDQGVVRTYDLTNGLYVYDQKIENYNATSAELFGARIKFINDGASLVIYSPLGDGIVKTTFDSNTTTYDRLSTRVADHNIDSGRIDVYDKYDHKFVYAETLASDNIQEEKFGYAMAAGNGKIVVSAPYENVNGVHSGSIYTYARTSSALSWNIVQQEADKVDISKIKKVFLYNKKTNQIITYLDIIDPIQGKIPGIAEQEIKYKTYYDPATYSVGTDAVNVDDGMSWTSKQVGMLWWNLTKAKFLDSYSGDVVYKNSTWNTLYDTASIDVYEWVESKLLPADWDKQADTDAGLALGISGTSLYGNTVYSVKKKYDTISKTFKNTYYYWVKNKRTIPNVANRSKSAYDVSALIANPKGQNHKYIEFTGANSFSLVNVQPLLTNTDAVLAVQYWLVEPNDLNIHTDWKLISENLDTKLPATIEKKWIDSLVGIDDNNQSVPDIGLPAKQRYGIQFRPRQSMFINRLEALKQYIERLNSVMESLLIVDSTDLTDLDKADPIPSTVTGMYDVVIDTDLELRLVNVGSFTVAKLTPVIIDGKIISVAITNPGSGYKYAPYVTITGDGVNAKIKTIINTAGQVTGVDIINKGYGYNVGKTTLSVRELRTLVKSDTAALGRWAIYAYDPTSEIWSRVESQAYDVTQFWNYIDWYATGYNQFTKIDYVVDGTYQLYTLATKIGQTVKVKNVGSAGWMLLEKFADVTSVDYTQSYTVVGRQNGSIKISDKFYKYTNTDLGYDGPLYDDSNFDNSGAAELKIILTAVKDKILIDELRVHYLELFFSSLKYALSEQTYVDWAFKTSFVKAMHNVGDLKQKVTYNNDNLSDFEAYINEVKPYRTKVREFISAYQNLDSTQTMISDFDLPPVTDGQMTVPLTVKFNESGTLEYSHDAIHQYPWKNWLDNTGFTITEIQIVDGGSGYISKPQVKIIGASTTPATARSYISNGKLIKVDLLTQGSGYFSAPTIEISGGLESGGTPARAVAIITNDLVRSNYVKIKFDRITRNYFITELSVTETFQGTNSRLQWPLKWSPDVKIGNSKVTINGQEALRGSYTISTKKSTDRGYTSYSGLLTFVTAPASTDVIVITYIKDFNYLNASDRINFYYNPTTGQLGKDLTQLMTGVDYGGVNVVGLGFNTSSGWDDLPWYSDVWDGFDPAYDDYLITADGSTHSFVLPYVPAENQEINVYVNDTRIDGTDNLMPTYVGDGIHNTITLPNGSFVSGNKLVFRKSTSDGSQISSSISYDTALTGGNLAYSTATGLTADDIIVDGDGFVTPTSSPATEEVVPGHVTDAVAIKVFHRPTNGSAKIISKNYIADGSQDIFDIDQEPNTQQAVIVKIGEHILENDTDYTIDYNTQTVILTAMPSAGDIVSVTSFGYNGTDILDLDYFVGDGSTIEFITRAPWVENATSLVVVSGLLQNYELFKTDDTYDSPNRVGIRFGAAPHVNDIINYLISGSVETSFSLARKDTIIADGTNSVYALSNTAGVSSPLETNVIVRTGDTILTGPNNTYYTLGKNKLTYAIPPEKFQAEPLGITDFYVYLNGRKLKLMTDYRIDLTKGAVVINKSVYVTGGILVVSIIKDAQYFITANTIEFTTTPVVDTIFEVTSYFNHDILEVERSEFNIVPTISLTQDTVEYFAYNQITNGLLTLDRPVVTDDYVWVIKNNKLLSHSIDYKLNKDLTSIKLAVDPVDSDQFVVMTFANNTVHSTFGYMQFKDMLNRVHYKRLSKDKHSLLAQDLHYYDSTIVVEDGSVFSLPNRQSNVPGIVYINGERIEYFTIDGNVLGQLRRGTLGTGTPAVHAMGEVVIDIGVSETVPYIDESIVDTHIYDGSLNIPVSFVPANVDEIEVFVGGYDIKGVWETNTSYSVGEILIHGSYTYKCVTLHTSTSFTADRAKWQLFVGNQRLKKVPYSVHNVELHYESPEGDVTFPADFSVTGSSKVVTLRNNLALGTKVVVVKKVGQVWNDGGKSLVDSNNKIANFLKEKTTIWPR